MISLLLSQKCLVFLLREFFLFRRNSFILLYSLISSCSLLYSQREYPLIPTFVAFLELLLLFSKLCHLDLFEFTFLLQGHFCFISELLVEK